MKLRPALTEAERGSPKKRRNDDPEGSNDWNSVNPSINQSKTPGDTLDLDKADDWMQGPVNVDPKIGSRAMVANN